MTRPTLELRKEGKRARSLSGAFCFSLLVLLSACASPSPDRGDAVPFISTDAEAARGAHMSAERGFVVAGDDAPRDGFLSRRVQGAAGMIGITLRSHITDPLVRPVSTARSLLFLVKNAASDTFRRALIRTVRLPALRRGPVPPVSGELGMNLAKWERELDELTGSTSTRGTLDFLVDGSDYFSQLVEDLEQAEQSIHVRTYIFDNDDVAVGIADLLKRRSRDVEVKVHTDAIGTFSGAQAVSETMPPSFERPACIATYLQEDSRIKVRLGTNPWFSGDHSKVTIIDRKVAYLGGMNIGREYRYDWHDVMVRVQGPVVEELARDADDAWARSGMLGDLAALSRLFRKPRESSVGEGYPVRILYTRTHSSQIYQATLAAIRRARNHIYIENPYFSDDALLFELLSARRRGVDVRFIIAERGDFPLMDMSNVQAINDMLRNGIRVYLYPGMAHAKAVIIDDWLMLGSANFDNLSMRVNAEVNISTSHPEAVEELKERLFYPDFAKSVELTEELPADIGNALAELAADLFM